MKVSSISIVYDVVAEQWFFFFFLLFGKELSLFTILLVEVGFPILCATWNFSHWIL